MNFFLTFCKSNRVAHDNPGAQRCTVGTNALNTTKIPREDNQRKTKRAKMGVGDEKMRNFGRSSGVPRRGPEGWCPEGWGPGLLGPRRGGPGLWGGPKGGGPEGWGGGPKGGGLPEGWAGNISRFFPSPAPKPPGFHTTAREPKRAHLRVPAFNHHQNSTRRPTREEERMKIVAGEGKKERNFWRTSGGRSREEGVPWREESGGAPKSWTHPRKF